MRCVRAYVRSVGRRPVETSRVERKRRHWTREKKINQIYLGRGYLYPFLPRNLDTGQCLLMSEGKGRAESPHIPARPPLISSITSFSCV